MFFGLNGRVVLAHWVARSEPLAMGVVCITPSMPRPSPEAQGRATPLQRVAGAWETDVLNQRGLCADGADVE